MTNTELVSKLQDIVANYNTVYLWGGTGQYITDANIASKANQYKSWYTSDKLNTIYYPLVGKDYWGFDCVNVVKGLVWGWVGDRSKSSGGAGYNINGCPDYSANQMIDYCTNVSTDFSNLQVGEALWCEGHFGVYIGDGYAIEATPKWGYTPGVKLSAVTNTGLHPEYSKQRTWTKHGFMPYISYVDASNNPIDISKFDNQSYIAPSSSSNVSGNSTENYYTFSYSEYESLANMGTQPFHALVDLWLGNTHVPQIPPQYMVSCEITMLNSESAAEAGSAVSVTITLFDKYCDELEYLFIVNQNNIRLRFGDTQGRQSTVLSLIAKQYNINFRPNGNILTVQLTANGYGGDASSLVTLSGGASPSDAVRSIANRMGWAIGRIDESVQLEGQGGEFVEFNLINDNPVDYIRNEIAPRAIRTSDGKGGFQFYLDPTTDPNTVNFFPIDLESGGLRTYVYQKGKNSPVIDFSMTDTITLAESSLASEYRASGVDPLTKEEFSLVKSYSDTIMDVSGNNKTSISDDDNPQLMVTDSSSRSEISAETAYRFTTHINGLNGTLTIVGDPTISITDMVRIIILNNDNTMHSISGIYQVKGVNHNITSGTMITTLNVVKTTNIMDASTTLKSAKVVK